VWRRLASYGSISFTVRWAASPSRIWCRRRGVARWSGTAVAGSGQFPGREPLRVLPIYKTLQGRCLSDDMKRTPRNNRGLRPRGPSRLPSYLWQRGQAQFCFNERKPGSGHARKQRDFRAATSSRRRLYCEVGERTDECSSPCDKPHQQMNLRPQRGPAPAA